MVSVDPVVESTRGISQIASGNSRNLSSKFPIESSIETSSRQDISQQSHAIPVSSRTQAFAPGVWARFGKRPADLIGAVLLAVVFAIPMVFIALLVKVTSPGPVFFRQTRVGLHGREFTIWKFRSMTHDAETRLRRTADLSTIHQIDWKIKRDPRVTGLGRVLRKTSLDELPQIINVVMGDMSVVGPRPVQPQELVKQYGDAAQTIVSVRPGMTGLWQVSGRSDLSYEERVQLDVSYVQDVRLSQDVQIVLRTVPAVILGCGAV